MASYLTIVIPLIVVGYNLCTSGNLCGIVKPVTEPTPMDKKATEVFHQTLAPGSEHELKGQVGALTQQQV